MYIFLIVAYDHKNCSFLFEKSATNGTLKLNQLLPLSLHLYFAPRIKNN